MKIYKISILLTMICSEMVLWAQNQVILDSTFGGNGIVRFLATAQDAWDYSMLIQPDGKIVAAGRTQNDVLIVRYNSDGSLDNSFNLDGSALFPIGTGLTSSVRSYTIALQPDNKMVFAAYNTSDGNVKVMRCNVDGSVDNSFGTNGIVTENLIGPNKVPIVIQSDSKIVVAGKSTVGAIGVIVLRYNTDGTIDGSFGSGGSTAFTSLGKVRDMVIQSNGKFVISGVTGSGEVLIIRLNSDGTADNSFGTGGIASIDIGAGDDIGNSVKVQTDGKIVVAGVAGSTANSFFVVRVNPNGTLDNSFDLDGKVTYQLGAGANGGNSVVIDSAGKIIVAGYARNVNNDDDFTLIRLNTNGSIDTSFNSIGYVYTDINSGSDDGGTSIALQSDGKMVVAGYSGPSNDRLAIVRYSSVGSGGGTTPCVVTTYDTVYVTVLDTTHITAYDTTYVTNFDTTYVTVYDTVHSVVTDTLLINFHLSGVAPPNDYATIKAYPNPASDHLYINTGNYANLNGYKIKITNTLSQVVFVTAINQQIYSVDLSNWTGNGTYFISILDPSNNIIEVKKIILQ